jgi:hypothetical protein
MPRKKFEDPEPRSPLDADLLRDAVAIGRQRPTGQPAQPKPEPESASAASQATPAPMAKKRGRPPTSPKPPGPALAVPSRLGKTSDGPTKRVRISADEDLEISQFLSRLRRETKARINISQLARAGWTMALRAEEELVAELKRSPLPRTPSTQDTVSYAAYEEEILRRLHRVFRRARFE